MFSVLCYQFKHHEKNESFVIIVTIVATSPQLSDTLVDTQVE